MPTQPDILQQIAQYQARTDDPRMTANGGDDADPNQEPIGHVPMHLRHVHNLLTEKFELAGQAELEYRQRKEEAMALRTLFFGSLKSHVSQPEGSNGIEIRPDWSVIAKMDDDSGSDMLGMLAAALAGGRRR